jgi:EmrB/QacA subfamily drug resistance transporter
VSTIPNQRAVLGGPGPGGAAAVSPQRWRVLGVALAGAFMILLDATIVNVALPAIQRGLDASDAQLQWVGAGYALTFGLVLIPAGRLGDRVGHRRVFLVGLVGFTVLSALCGAAGSAAALVGFRLAQGAAAGALNAPILPIIQAVFPPQERGRAFGAYGVVAGVATAVGPLVGGLLIEGDLGGLGWRPIFLINVPLGIAVLILALRLVPDARGRGGGLDPVGIVLVATALLLVIVPLVEGPESDWPTWTYVCLVLALPVFAIFAWFELRRTRSGAVPLVDVRLFGRRPVTAGVVIATVHFAGFVGLAFSFSLYLQLGLGQSALVSGLVLTGFAAGTMVGGATSDNLANALGRTVLQLGAGLLAVGIVLTWLTISATGGLPVWWALPGLALAGVGNGIVIGPTTHLVLASVPGPDTGSVSGVLNTAQRLGQALGTAILGTLFFSSLTTAFAAGEPQDAAYNHAVQVALLGSLACAIVTFLVVYALPRSRPA